MFSLSLAKIYCLRAAVANCVAALLLFISDTALRPLNKEEWLSLGLTFFILLHHLLM
jgi:hypothetical protein